MKRFRTGRAAPPWAGGKTGPMTVDVEDCMSNINRTHRNTAASLNPSGIQPTQPEWVNTLVAGATLACTPVAEVTPAPAAAEVSAASERATAEIYTPAAAAAETDSQVERAEADEPTGPFATVKLVYVGPGSSPECERIPASIHTEGDSPERAERAAFYPEPRRAIAPQASDPSPQRQGTAFYPESRRAAVPQIVKHSGVSTLAAEPTTEATAIAPKRSHHKRKRAKRKPRPIPTIEQVTLYPAAPRKQSQPKTQTEIDLSHHQRRCSICHHPEREAIEEAFLQWRRVRNIDQDFKPDGGPTAIYRHARAFNLFKQRNLGLRSALEFVIERAENVMPTAEGLVKAIRAYTRINDAGEWIDTPTTHIVKVIPMRDPEPRNVTNSASAHPEGGRACPDEGRGSVTLDVKKISTCPREGRVEVTVESPSGRPFLTGSAPQTEFDATT